MAAPFKLDENLLQELGLGSLPVDEKNRMLQHIYETLEMRVGMRLAEQMSDQQLDEFESFIDRSDEPGALKWLETNFPNYKDVVAQELEKLKGEIKVVAPQIVAQSQAAAQGGQPAPMMAQPQQPSAQVPPQPYQPAPQPYQAPQPQYQQPMPQQAPPAPMPQSPNPYQQPYQSPQYAPVPPNPTPSPSVPPMPPQPQYGAPQPMPQAPPSWQQPPQQ